MIGAWSRRSAPAGPWFLLAFALGVALPLRAGTAVPALQVRVVERDVAPDGFDDPAWALAVPAAGITQQEPDEGRPATLAAECRVVATPTALLLRFRLAQPADELVAHELRRDASLVADDQIAFVLDPWHDRRNAYYFATNPNGVRVDGLVSEQRAPSLDWDTIWDARVRRTSEGWEALFRIPFASIAFPGGQDGAWGFNYERDARGRSERSLWAGWRRPWQLYQVSHAGELTGLPSMPARRLRQVTPYFAGSLDHRQEPADTDLLGKPGVDARYGVTSSIEADLTVDTDFAETEVDAQQFNFGRTSLFFPEKRAFFLQRSQVFEFGDKDTTIPFFSRRIGLSDGGQPIPIDAGLKVTGRSGRTDFGALAVRTRESQGEPRADFLAGRVKQDVGRSTYLGALATYVDRGAGASPGHSSTFGFDMESNPAPEWRLNTYYVRTATPGATGKEDAWSADLYYTGRHLRGEVQRASYGAGYDPQVGYVAQSGIAFWYFALGWVARPRLLGLQDLSLDLFYFPKDNEDGTPNERWGNARLHATWLNGAYADAYVLDSDENLTEPLDLGGHAAIPTGRYRFRQLRLTAGTNPSRPVALQAAVATGGYFDGDKDTYRVQLDLKPSEHVALSLFEEYDVVRLPSAPFDLSLFSARVDWNPSVKLLTSAIVQVDNVDELTAVQVVVRWLVDPATDLFVVLNRQVGAGFEQPGTRLTVKFRKSFDI